MPVAPRSPYLYAIIRVVPHVERGESINAGVVLLSRSHRYLGARMELDDARLAAIAPECDPTAVHANLAAIEAIARGDAAAGAMARLTLPERFHWLVAPSSTIIQPSPVHTGLTDDPAAELEHLVATLVR